MVRFVYDPDSTTIDELAALVNTQFSTLDVDDDDYLTPIEADDVIGQVLGATEFAQLDIDGDGLLDGFDVAPSVYRWSASTPDGELKVGTSQTVTYTYEEVFNSGGTYQVFYYIKDGTTGCLLYTSDAADE